MYVCVIIYIYVSLSSEGPRFYDTSVAMKTLNA